MVLANTRSKVRNHRRKEEIEKRKKEGNEAGKEGRKEKSHLLHICAVNILSGDDWRLCVILHFRGREGGQRES